MVAAVVVVTGVVVVVGVVMVLVVVVAVVRVVAGSGVISFLVVSEFPTKTPPDFIKIPFHQTE